MERSGERLMEASANVANVLYQNIAAGRENKTVIFSAETAFTFGELVRFANRAGNALKSLGVERENRVVLLLGDGLEFVASFYGAMAIGAVPVPLNTSLTPADYEFLLNHSRARVAIVGAALAYLIEPIRSQCPHLRQVVLVGGSRSWQAIEWQTWTAGASPELEPVEVSPDEPAFWLYSSGSTGRLKAVVHLHRAIPFTCRQYAQRVLELGDSDICFSAAKLFHAYGLGNGMNFPLFVGASTVLWHGATLPEALFELINRFHPTIFFATPALFVRMLEVKKKYDLSSLRFCVSAGEALPALTFERWRDRFGVEIVDGIGSTEMLHIFVSNRPGRCVAGSSGQVVPGYQVKIVDETGALLSPGEIGDLWVSGESSAIGYWHDRARTQATMRGEWVVTGDKYFQDEEGCFWYQGRSDDMLKVNGVWVSPIELENILNESPGVAECAVIGLRDEDELLQVKAFVVLKPGVEPSAAMVRELQKFVRLRAPQKYPRMFEFVESLPKTATGKIKRFRLRAAETESCS
jgi:benzoate-CoA ligase family protein